MKALEGVRLEDMQTSYVHIQAYEVAQILHAVSLIVDRSKLKKGKTVDTMPAFPKELVRKSV